MQEFNKKTKHINELMSLTPDLIHQYFAKKNEDLSQIAPQLAVHVQTTAMNGLKLLHDKLPKPRANYLGQENKKISQTEMKSWDDLHSIVNDPITILDHVNKGTITNNHIQAVQSLYPDLLQEMKMKVAEHMNHGNMKNMSYAKKISLSKFLGFPVDGSLEEQSMMNNLMHSKVLPQNQQQNQQNKSTQSGLKELKLGDREATSTQDQQKLKS